MTPPVLHLRVASESLAYDRSLPPPSALAPHCGRGAPAGPRPAAGPTSDRPALPLVISESVEAESDKNTVTSTRDAAGMEVNGSSRLTRKLNLTGARGCQLRQGSMSESESTMTRAGPGPGLAETVTRGCRRGTFKSSGPLHRRRQARPGPAAASESESVP